ncbi:hypothetical protein EUTSA_v10010592mg [Eutrema salsugineum]|uniref:1-phosphatidylinositol 4-kinase n=1 Tax=Eutrema salsugineum TaxID=72664 RepID=V4M0W6_EUTSA|nr:hypothetical protein EUTSA_v10010592mg [Eutrema salsugineum]
MEEIFPTLAHLPRQLSTNFQQMIDWLRGCISQGELPKYRDLPNLFRISDEEGRLRCLFKKFDDGDEISAKKEASVYLLDHPMDAHRSESPNIKGFSGVLPTLFVRFSIGNANHMGVLIEYMESLCVIGHYEIKLEKMNMGELVAIGALDIRFGNMDRNQDNILVREDVDGIAHFTPVDHEMIFGNAYNICSPCWLSLVKGSVNSPEDIEFLTLCGWEPTYANEFRVCTNFLKEAVLQGITLHHIGNSAAFKCANFDYNLQMMVNSVENGDNFIVNVRNLMRERLTEYRASL